MSDLQNAKIEFLITILGAETERLSKAGIIQPGHAEPWRHYEMPPDPADPRYEYEELQCYLEAGKGVVDAENAETDQDLNEAIIRAQAALLCMLSTYGKGERKRLGQREGGRSRNESIREKIFVYASELEAEGLSLQEISSKVADSLMARDSIDKSPESVRSIVSSLVEEGKLEVNLPK